MTSSKKNAFLIECDAAYSSAADCPAMSNPLNLWLKELQSRPLTHWNKDIPPGINSDPEPLIGSLVKAPRGYGWGPPIYKWEYKH